MIVCIGASAGGLDPIIHIIENLGVEQEEHAFVIIQHLAKDKKSHMQDILTPKTNFKVKVIEDLMPIENGVIYLSPPGFSVLVHQDHFVLKPIELSLAQRTIDNFFISAANIFKSSCLGVILSGSGSDGQKGCQEIFDLGGEVFVQDPEEAEFKGMPDTVIRSGFFTKIIKIDSFNAALKSISKDMDLPEDLKFFDLASNQLERLGEILAKTHSFNLKDYKKPTIIRRFIKRIKYLGFDKVDEYLKLLEKDSKEADKKYN